MHGLSLLASEVHVCMHAGNTFCGHRANSIPSNLIASRIMWLRADTIRFSVQTDNYTAAFEYNYTCSPMTRWYCLVSSLQCGTRLFAALCVGANEVFHFCWAIEDDKEFKSLAALSSQLPSALLLWPFVCVRVHVHMCNVMYVASFTYIVYYTCTCICMYMYMHMYMHVHTLLHFDQPAPSCSHAHAVNSTITYIIWCVLTLID